MIIYLSVMIIQGSETKMKIFSLYYVSLIFYNIELESKKKKKKNGNEKSRRLKNVTF